MQFLPLRFLGLCLLVTSASTALAEDLPALESRDEITSGVVFKFLKLFPGKDGLLVGRFRLSNDSASLLKVWGKPSAMTEIIGLSPSQDKPAYQAFVRLNEKEPNPWIPIPKPPDAVAVKAQAYELYPGEIRYLDLLLPNAKNKPKAELVVQLYVEVTEQKKYLNSTVFHLTQTQ